MDFPVFHLDFFGNRLLIAAVAVFHVFLNHPLAVGAMPLVTALEWWGMRRGDEAWDQLARRVLLVCFILTTSVGALSGVGIWVSTSLVNPAAIGSLIRVFFWAWFFEWLVFVAEVVLIMAYTLTWEPMKDRKGAHVALGVALSVFSWVTMAVITAILGFMMEPGSWLRSKAFLSGVFNPLYLPQLAFRTPLAMVTAATFVLFLVVLFARSDRDLRGRAVRFVSLWTLAWLPVAALGSAWYWRVVPEWARANLPVALTTQDFTRWHRAVGVALAVMVVAVLLQALVGAARPTAVPRALLVVPFVVSLLTLATFERVREFIRKPWVIGGYLYANGLRAEEYPLLEEEGVLAHSAYVSVREVEPATRLEAGREVFRVACTRCHTTTGVNGILRRLEVMYGAGPWDRDTVKAYLASMHRARPFMPPAPGSDAELGALADYLLDLRRLPLAVDGAQATGVTVAPALAPAVAGP